MSQELTFLEIDPSEIRIPNENSVNPQTGAAITSVGIPVTAGRNNFQPSLSLSYNSNAGNSVFGIGWNLEGVPSIGISLKDGYPKYDGSDKFSFGGQELVPWLEEIEEEWSPREEETALFHIQYFRARIDTSYSRFEKWDERTTGKTHWRVRARDNSILIFGHSADDSSKIVDPIRPNVIFQWLLDTHYDSMGNAILYEYVQDNTQGVLTTASFEKNKFLDSSSNAQKYLKRIRYGNGRPEYPDSDPEPDQIWHFELIFDYGDQETDTPPFYSLNATGWSVRPDPFSSYVAGFEQRTYRLCHRILMFHHFEDLGSDATLIGNLKLAHAPAPEGTILTHIEYERYKRMGSGNYDQKTIPALRFSYSQPAPDQSFRPAPEQSNTNIPIGLSGLNYKWVDLYGEGLPGVLYESNNAWYFKHNLGDGNLGNQQRVIEKPSIGFGNYALNDFDGDGNLNLVVLQGRESGFYEYDRDRKTWDSFKAFDKAPHVRSQDTNTQLLDLTGDGRSDIVTVEEDRLVWYPAEGKAGFGMPVQMSKPISNGVSRAPTIGVNPMLDYFFADMNGSGLPDQVRIYNGRVEYWPNMGNGKFGAGIVMENAPQLDFDFELDASRIRLVDLDGSGTSDLVYLDRGKIRYWINASGNFFLEENSIDGLPFIDNLASAQILDFLGDGTPCLVWSSTLNANTGLPLSYLRLTKGVKPRLMIRVENSMGLETRFHYGYSGQHFLRDKQAGEPWMTQIPSHKIVVDTIERIDQIGNTRFRQRFEYRDGFFDGEERTFRGFCLVDQYDSDVYLGDSTVPEAEFSDPVCVRTWYHNGAVGWQKERTKGYYRGDTFGTQLRDFKIEEIDTLGPEEYFDAIQSLAGQVVRSETYGVTQEGRKEHPFQIAQAAFAIRRLQPGKAKHDACYTFFQREQLEILFEEDPSDPRISHAFTKEVDAYGIPFIQASVAYPRIHSDALPEQEQFHLTATQVNVDHFDSQDRYELGIEWDRKILEIHHENPPPEGLLYSYEDMEALLDTALDRPISFNASFDRAEQARVLQWVKNYYWNTALTAVLPFEEVGDKILLHHQEIACFNNDFLDETLGPRLASGMLSEGYYLSHDGLWWQPTAVTEFLGADRFYLPIAEEQVNGGRTAYQYDTYSLALISSEAILVNERRVEVARNRVAAQIDYNLIAPYWLEDSNQNVSEVQYDPFGIVLLSSVHGNILSESGTVQRMGHRSLSDYIEPSTLEFGEIIDSPNNYLRQCATYFYYELDSWQRHSLPLRSVQLAREDWVYDGQGNYLENGTVQVAVSYLDGFGRVIQTKTLVEGGEATVQYEGGRILLDPGGEPELLTTGSNRWRTSGHVVFNNKQEGVKQYEPYFITSVDYVSNEVVDTFGQASLTTYDAVGRQKAIFFPDGTRNRNDYAAWYTRQLDANDWVEGSLYETRIETEHAEDSPEWEALQKSLAHRNTGITAHTDGLGRTFMTEEEGLGGEVRTNKTVYDVLGNPIELRDARELPAFRYVLDMQSRLFYEESMDSGPKWQFMNALDLATNLWDARGMHQQITFDSWGRVVQKQVEGPPDLDHITERFIYGEDPSVTDAASRNQFGKLVEHYDQAGLTRISGYDIIGNVLRKERSLLDDYTRMMNWSTASSPIWTADSPFVSQLRYNALGGTVEQRFPDDTIRRFSYSLSGALEQLLVSTVDGEWIDKPIVTGSSYNARGQSLMTTYGNNLVQRYEYDPLSFRLTRKRSYIPAGSSAPSRQYQNIQYTYDAVGNITQLRDTAQPQANALFTSARVNTYTYDAFYQLIEAQGRTHQAMQRTDHAHGFEAPGFIKGTRHLNLGNLDQLQTYTRTYRYDLNGNMESMVQSAGSRPSDVFRWRRDFWISRSSNRSMDNRDLRGNPEPRPEEHFDENGNLEYLPHLRAIYWNYQNQLQRAMVIERPSGEHDEEYYVYGGDGQRVRKVSHRLDNGSLEVTEKIYLDGCEIKRVRTGASVLLERFTSDINDGRQRVALVHHWTRDTRGRETTDLTERKVYYHLNCHLGSAAFELGERGEIINYEEYFAFGGSSFLFGEALRDVRAKDYRYSGKERDDVTKLYYYGFRYYAPWLCRWMNPDPIGPEDGLNVYQFVHNNPLSNVDPDGLQSSENRRVTPIPYSQLWNSLSETQREAVNNFRSVNPNGAIALTPEGQLLLGAEARTAIENSQNLALAVPERTSEQIIEDVERELEEALVNAGMIVPEGLGGQGEGGANSEEDEGSGSGDTSGSQSGDGTNGSDDTGNGQGGGSGSGGGGDGSQRRRGSGQGNSGRNGRPGGRTGGTGTGRTNQENQEVDVPIGENRPENEGLPAQQGIPNPDAALQGNPNGTALGPEAVNSELPVGNGDPNGSMEGTSNGQAGGETPEDLAWWQTALIVVAVAIVAIAVTIVTFGAALAVMGVTAATATIGQLVIAGAVAGLASGLLADATSQLLTIAVSDQLTLEDYDFEQTLFSGAVGLVTGGFTAGLGGYASGARSAVLAGSASRGQTIIASLSNRIGSNFITRGAGYFTSGALEGGGTEALRQAIFEDEFDVERVLTTGVISGGISLGISGGLDLYGGRSVGSNQTPNQTQTELPPPEVLFLELPDNPRNLPLDANGEPLFHSWLGGLIRHQITPGDTSDGISSALRAEHQRLARIYGTVDGPPIPGATGKDVHVGHDIGHAHVLSPAGRRVRVVPQTAKGNRSWSSRERALADRRRAWNDQNPSLQVPVRPKGKKRT
ncbi:SpvB/TcaC N-terminal domain-containing protein [Spongiimicrobium sp. 3-5]|uniref:SpvB/TcaC N-terminal domain-containing protein n=1 Tax=Spongiimicrobium sp. 3-5 TaxID=3332596 RepID=UPI003980D0FF